MLAKIYALVEARRNGGRIPGLIVTYDAAKNVGPELCAVAGAEAGAGRRREAAKSAT